MVENEAGSPTENIGTSGGKVGFYSVTPVARQATASLSLGDIQVALVNLGLISV